MTNIAKFLRVPAAVGSVTTIVEFDSIEKTALSCSYQPVWRRIWLTRRHIDVRFGRKRNGMSSSTPTSEESRMIAKGWACSWFEFEAAGASSANGRLLAGSERDGGFVRLLKFAAASV